MRQVYWVKYEDDFIKANFRPHCKGEPKRLSALMNEQYPDAPAQHRTPRGVYFRLRTLSKNGIIDF